MPISKSKGDPLNTSPQKGIRLFEHDFKLYEKVLDGRLGEIVHINKMLFSFMPGRSTVGAVFVLRRLAGKFRSEGKRLFYAFSDLEKAFDRVLQEEIYQALREKGASEYLVHGAMSIYSECKTAVSVASELSESFLVQVGDQQGSVLSSLLCYHCYGFAEGRFEGQLPTEVVLY